MCGKLCIREVSFLTPCENIHFSLSGSRLFLKSQLMEGNVRASIDWTLADDKNNTSADHPTAAKLDLWLRHWSDTK